MAREHERRFRGAAERLRAPERIVLMEVDRVVTLVLEGLEAPRVLDVGTGTAVFAEAFAARGLSVAGIDANPSLLKAAKTFAPDVDFKVGTAEAIPYGDGSFDLAFLGHVLHEADDPVAALREARRVSRKRVAVLEWPFVREEHGPPLAHRLEADAIARMAERAGLGRIERVSLTHMELYRMAVKTGSP
jgi:ubiquinone/menaquinone biosynthesis C-methylase UbiE